MEEETPQWWRLQMSKGKNRLREDWVCSLSHTKHHLSLEYQYNTICTVAGGLVLTVYWTALRIQ